MHSFVVCVRIGCMCSNDRSFVGLFSGLVRPDAAQYCEQVKEQDGFAVWQEGCVYWSKAKPSCTIVTTGKTTHSQMGRLFLYCMDAGEPS
jgi:hypothetical protein